MRFLIAVTILLAAFHPKADPKRSAIKSWKTLQSDAGYEFKYPDCWQIQGEDYEEGSPETLKSMSVSETTVCARPRFNKWVENGIGFRGGAGPKNKREDAEKEIKLRERNAPNDIQRGEYLVFKRLKLGKDDAIAWVRDENSFFRWELKVYCPDWWISVSGPSIDKDSDMAKPYFEKFKKGDLALPEPEKTILDSVRCIPAKQK